MKHFKTFNELNEGSSSYISSFPEDKSEIKDTTKIDKKRDALLKSFDKDLLNFVKGYLKDAEKIDGPIDGREHPSFLHIKQAIKLFSFSKAVN
jgi:hypothetical protein